MCVYCNQVIFHDIFHSIEIIDTHFPESGVIMRESFTRFVRNSKPEDVEENGWKTESNSYGNLKTQNGGEMKWTFSH
jgi:hypothetical protein